MKNNILAAILIGVFTTYLTACTATTVTTPEGLEITHRDFHPVGQAVETDVTWEGVGTLSTRRSNQGSEGIIDGVGDIINPVEGILNGSPE